MIWSILINIILMALLVLSVMWGIKQKKKPRQMKKNIDIILDHENTDAEVKKAQVVVKKKIIEAKNEKESDAVIKHIFSVANNPKL